MWRSRRGFTKRFRTVFNCVNACPFCFSFLPLIFFLLTESIFVFEANKLDTINLLWAEFISTVSFFDHFSAQTPCWKNSGKGHWRNYYQQGRDMTGVSRWSDVEVLSRSLIWLVLWFSKRNLEVSQDQNMIQPVSIGITIQSELIWFAWFFRCNCRRCRWWFSN